MVAMQVVLSATSRNPRSTRACNSNSIQRGFQTRFAKSCTSLSVTPVTDSERAQTTSLTASNCCRKSQPYPFRHSGKPRRNSQLMPEPPGSPDSHLEPYHCSSSNILPLPASSRPTAHCNRMNSARSGWPFSSSQSAYIRRGVSSSGCARIAAIRAASSDMGSL